MSVSGERLKNSLTLEMARDMKRILSALAITLLSIQNSSLHKDKL